MKSMLDDTKEKSFMILSIRQIENLLKFAKENQKIELQKYGEKIINSNKAYCIILYSNLKKNIDMYNIGTTEANTIMNRELNQLI